MECTPMSPQQQQKETEDLAIAKKIVKDSNITA
jgi:hypothetical protein